VDGKDSKEARSCYIYPVGNLRILEIAAIMVDPFGIVEEPSIATVITLAAVIAWVEEVMLKVEIRAVLKPQPQSQPLPCDGRASLSKNNLQCGQLDYKR